METPLQANSHLSNFMKCYNSDYYSPFDGWRHRWSTRNAFESFQSLISSPSDFHPGEYFDRLSRHESAFVSRLDIPSRSNLCSPTAHLLPIFIGN